MNLVLLEPAERELPLPRTDVRTQHILEILKRGVGDTFEAGVVDGPIGTATVTGLDDAGLRFQFEAKYEPPPLPDVTLVVGLPRPATARDVLRDATTLGVRAIHFVSCELATGNYAASSLWRNAEHRPQLKLGASQAFCTRLPEVTWTGRLSRVLADLPGTRLALDNYQAEGHLSTWAPSAPGPVTVVIGPERGWGTRDHATLRSAGASFYHLGSRILRVEMAVVAALSFVHGRGR